MLDLVLFDYGGVVCPLQSVACRLELARLTDLSFARFSALWSQYRPSYDLGIIDGPEYWSRVLRHGCSTDRSSRVDASAEVRTRSHGDDPSSVASRGERPGEQLGPLEGTDLFTELIQTEIESWLDLDTGLLSWAEKLRDAGIRTGVLSNMPPELVEDTKGRPWIEPFEPCFFSADLRAMKPYAAIYQRVIEAVGVDPNRVLFLDDQPNNVHGAQGAGLQAIHYRGLDRLLPQLRALGLPPP